MEKFLQEVFSILSYSWFLLLLFFQIVKLEQHKDECVVHIYLFIGTDSQDLDQSVNRQLAQSHLWNQASTPERNVGEAKG